MHTLTMEENPDGTITFVRGLIINNGDTPVEVNNIRVIVSVSVPGKSDMLDVPASLSPGSNVLSQGDTCKFVALVPNGTNPDYRVRVIINSQE